ncbi:MAG: hypothetical protein QM688_14265 [Sphingomonas bacterium]
MKKLLLAFALGSTVLAGAPAFAQTTPPAAQTPPAPGQDGPGWHGRGHRGWGHEMRGDPNRVVTRAEWLRKAGERFDRMDLNHDGKITPDERKAVRQQMREKFRERMEMRRNGAQPAPAPTPAPRAN